MNGEYIGIDQCFCMYAAYTDYCMLNLFRKWILKLLDLDYWSDYAIQNFSVRASNFLTLAYVLVLD